MKSFVIRNLWKEYAGRSVLERVNLSVGAKEFCAIVGASGCGKTTFLRILLGQETPSRGQVLMDGQAVCAEPGPERGVVFQRYSVFNHLSVIDNVMLGPELSRARFTGRLWGKARRALRDRARDMLASVGLAGSQDQYPAALSGGMQQRLAIAQSLMMEPQILLLDEPFGALDPGIRADMHRLVLKLWAEREMCVFMITHDIREAFQMGTRLLVFDRTRIDPQAPEAYGATITYDIPLKGADRSLQKQLQETLNGVGVEPGHSRKS